MRRHPTLFAVVTLGVVQAIAAPPTHTRPLPWPPSGKRILQPAAQVPMPSAVV